MRLITHNFLMCNVKTCEKNINHLAILVTKSKIFECGFQLDSLIKLIPKLDWNTLYLAIS